jgi:hypothetical protein
MLDEGIHFTKGTFIEQKINSFAGCEPAFFMLRFDPFGSAAEA